MAWTAPTVAQFKARFPEFSTVEDATVQMVLDEAVGEVSDSWVERDRTPAVLYLTAHLLAMSGWGVLGAGGGGAAVTGTVKRRRVGDVEVEFSGLGHGATGTDPLASFQATRYGQQYLYLMRRNFSGPLVV